MNVLTKTIKIRSEGENDVIDVTNQLSNIEMRAILKRGLQLFLFQDPRWE